MAKVILRFELLEDTHLLSCILLVEFVVPRRAMMDRKNKLSRGEFHNLALFIDNLEEGLLAQCCEEDVQIKLG